MRGDLIAEEPARQQLLINRMTGKIGLVFWVQMVRRGKGIHRRGLRENGIGKACGLRECKVGLKRVI
jgi:hypothetical protein